MSKPGNRKFGEDLAPFFAIYIEDIYVAWDISQYIQSVEYESAVDLVDLAQLTISNPGFVFGDKEVNEAPDWTAHKVFQPGNHIDIYFGYGPLSAAVPAGRGIIAKHLPSFPEDGLPTLTIKAYDGSFVMMDESAKVTIARKGASKKALGKARDEVAANFKEKRHDQIVRDIALKYGMLPDIDSTTKVDTIIQKKGLSDFQLVKGLAGINSKDFWIDWDYVLKQWTLHWKDWKQKVRPGYEFKYASGDETSLLSFSPSFGLKDQSTEIQVMYFSKQTQQWQYITIADTKEGADLILRKGSGQRQTARRKARAKQIRSQRELVNEEIRSASELRLVAGGHSIDVIPDKSFKDAQEAQEFAKRWYLARKEHFIIGEGTLIGVEDLRARQVHKLSNIGKRFSGHYTFTKVRHVFESESGYRIRFTAHKVLD